MDRETLANYSCKYHGSWHRIAKAIKDNEVVGKVVIKDDYITILDDEYPERLRALRYPPWVLFYKGNLSLLNKPMIGIIGSREMGNYAASMTEMMVATLPEKYGIVSGLAKGVDGCAHACCLQMGRKTIGVIGSGLKYRYPYENEGIYLQMEKDGLILSEYPYDEGVKSYHFPWRNRIIAALSDKIIVTSAKRRSGTMLTVNEAITVGKEVWCDPYPMDNALGEGCNLLIQQGAQIIVNKNDIESI